MTKTLPISEARQNLITLVDRANKRLDEFVITVNGKPAAVLVSAKEYDSWRETNQILADKKLMKAIKQGEKDMEKGRLYDWEEVKKELGINV